MALGVGVATLIIVLCIGANTGLEQRDARTAWRNPAFEPDPSGESLGDLKSVTEGGLLVTVLDQRGGEPFTRSTYAAVGPNAPVPPGLARLPEPGEVWVSPALLEQATTNPGVLAAFATPAGIISQDGLAHPQEMAVIIGARPDDPAFAEQPLVPIWRLDETYGPAAVTEMPTTSSGSDIEMYRLMAALGSVILIVPALSMIGGAARMMTGRRSNELAKFRLVGATASQTRQLAILDTLRASVLGTAAGLVLSLPALRLFESTKVAGGSWFAGDLTPGPAVFVLVGLVVVIVSVVAAISTLRRVNTSPLGVVTNDKPAGAVWLRALGLIGAMVFFYQTVSSPNASQVAILAAWAAILASTMIIGPLLVRLIAAVWLSIARRPVNLLAARRLLDDPKAAYRQIGGLALASLIAGMLASVSGPAIASFGADARSIDFAIPADTPATEIDELTRALEPLTTDITIDDDFDTYPTAITVATQGDVDVEQIRTAVTDVVPASLVASRAEQSRRVTQFIDDFQQASLLMIAVAGLAAAVGVASQLTTSILDQRKPLTALRLTGVPIEALAAARRRAVVVPLVMATSSAGMLGIWVGVVFGETPIAVRPFGLLFITVLAAIGLTLAADRITRPMLQRYTTDRSVLDN